MASSFRWDKYAWKKGWSVSSQLASSLEVGKLSMAWGLSVDVAEAPGTSLCSELLSPSRIGRSVV